MAAMNSLFVCILFVSYYLRGTQAASRYERLQKKYGDVVKEVAELRESHMQISKALKSLCANLDSSRDPVNKSKEVDVMEDEPFQVFSLELHYSEFRIEYDGNVTDEAVYIERETPTFNMTTMAPEWQISTARGIITGQVTLGYNFVSIVAGRFVAAVSFKPKTESTPIVNFEPQRMRSEVRENIVFESGQTTEFKVNLSKIDIDSFASGMYTPFSEPDQDGGVLLAVSRSPGTVNITAKKEYPEYNEVTITVNGDKEDHEGLLYLSLSSYEDAEGLAHLFYGVYQVIQVKRTDHKDPFEVGFVSFVKNEHKYFRAHCLSGEICQLKATLVGNLPDDVTLWKKNGLKKTQVEVPKVRREFSKFAIFITFYLQSPSVADQGQYIFRGTSHNGTVVEKEIPLSIIPNQPFNFSEPIDF